MLGQPIRPHTTGEYGGATNEIAEKSENERKCVTAQNGSKRRTPVSSSVEFIDKVSAIYIITCDLRTIVLEYWVEEERAIIIERKYVILKL